MNKILLNNARNCLRYIIKAFNIKEIYVPYYDCPSLRNAIRKENCKIVFYHIDKNFLPVKNFPKDAYILYTNYFGICDKNIDYLCKIYKNIIIDNAHSFYSKPKGIACFYSLRKFFPKLQDGAILYTQKIYDGNIKKDDYQYTLHTLSFEEFCKNENRLDNEDIKYISPVTEKYFISTDISKDLEKRTEKYNYWKDKLSDTNCLNLNNYSITAPFGYPYLASSEKEANEFVSDLKLQGINIFRYWNNLPESYEEKIFYKNLAVISLNTSDL